MVKGAINESITGSYATKSKHKGKDFRERVKNGTRPLCEKPETLSEARWIKP